MSVFGHFLTGLRAIFNLFSVNYLFMSFPHFSTRILVLCPSIFKISLYMRNISAFSLVYVKIFSLHLSVVVLLCVQCSCHGKKLNLHVAKFITFLNRLWILNHRKPVSYQG